VRSLPLEPVVSGKDESEFTLQVGYFFFVLSFQHVPKGCENDFIGWFPGPLEERCGIRRGCFSSETNR
jgi:hypothetical protein